MPNLWRHVPGEDTDEQLTDLETGAFVPSVAPDGAQVAFQDEEGATLVLSLDSGQVRKVAEPSYRPGRPSWSPDCRFLAMAVTVPVSPRDTSGHNRCLVVDTSSGESGVHAVAEDRAPSPPGVTTARSGPPTGSTWSRSSTARSTGSRWTGREGRPVTPPSCRSW
ncbi:hypothetical protein ACWFMI_10025 [Nocardiopsis terrae]